MAASASHTGFPSRPYTAGFGGRAGTQTPYNAQQPSYYSNPLANAPPATAPARSERERREAEERGAALEQLSEEQREEVNEAFALFDLDKDQYIDYHEVKVAFKALGFDLSKSELLSLLQTHGVPANHLPAPGQQQQASSQQQQQQPIPPQNVTFTGPGRLLLSHAAFVQLAAQRIAARDPREEILRAFDLFDTNRTGMITLDDLRRVARELGEGLQEEELAAMIDEFDGRGEGGISREEFVGICLG